MTHGSSWMNLYQAAMVELDEARLPGSIAVARGAIERRMDELRAPGPADNGNAEESRKLANALQSLRDLERLECKTVRPELQRREA